MKRIFAISDTHRKMVAPPPGYDITIHLGDFIDYFSVGPTGEHADLYRLRFDLVRQHYTHVVCGNHERMFINRFGEDPDLLPDALTIQVEGVRIRASHYLALPRPAPPELDEYVFLDDGSVHPWQRTAELPTVPESLLENLYREVIRYDARLVLYGHTHQQRYDVYQGVHLVDTGFGEAGAAAEIIVDGTEVQVTMIPGLWERESV